MGREEQAGLSSTRVELEETGDPGPEAIVAPRTPHLIPQPGGGALLSGGVPGHRGAGGRTPDAIRAKLRKIITKQGIPWAKDLLSAPRAMACPHCGKEIEPPALDGVKARVTDTLYRVAVGTQQEVKLEGGMTLIHDTNTDPA